MEELQSQLLEKLKGYKFDELVEMLKEQKLPEVRESILNAMETYHTEKFLNWI